jgi:hypothetical protein
MNLKDIRAEVNKDIDDQLNNADINGWVNRALDDLTPFAQFKKKTIITLTNGVTDYTLPDDFMDVVNVKVDCGLRRLPLNDFDSSGYKVIGNTLSLQNTNTNSLILELIYIATLPHLLNDDDVPMIPANFHHLLVLYAVAKAKYADEEQGMQMSAMNEYESRKNDFIRFVNRQNPIQKIRDVYSSWQTSY